MKYSTHSFLLPFLLLAGIILNSCNGGSNRSAKETVISDSTCTNTVSSVQKIAFPERLLPYENKLRTVYRTYL